MIATSHPISTTFNFGIPARTCIEQTHLSNDVIKSSSYAPALSTSVKLKVEQIIKSLIKCFGHGVLNISNLPLFSDVIFWHLKEIYYHRCKCWTGKFALFYTGLIPKSCTHMIWILTKIKCWKMQLHRTFTNDVQKTYLQKLP